MKKIIGLLAVFSLQVFAEVAVIVHPSNTAAIDQKAVARIFTGKMKSFPNGDQIVPMNLSSNLEATKEFNDKALNRSESQLKAYWSKLVFTGKGTPPQAVDSPNEMLRLVSNNPNVIGYVDARLVNGSVKVVTTF